MSWEKVKLNEIIEGPISGEWGDDEGTIKVLRSTNFNNDGSLNLTSVVSRNIAKNKIQQKALKYGDIVIEKSGGSPTQPVGRVVYFNIQNEVFLCNNFTSVIRPKNVNSRYLFWFLFNNHYTGKTLKYQNKTTGIINLQLSRYVKEIQITLPPLHIQKQIANILDKADALRKKDQQLLQKYDELAQAIFIDMFGDPVKNEKGWEMKNLGQVFKEGVKCGPFGSALKKDEYISSGIPVWVMDNIVDFNFKENGCLFISQQKYFELHSYKVSNGDIIISRAGTVGKMCVVNSNHEDSIISTNLIRLSLDEKKILPDYFVFLMKYFSNKVGRLKKGNEGAFTHMNTGGDYGQSLPVFQ